MQPRSTESAPQKERTGMPLLNHAADPPCGPLALVTQTATRVCAQAMQNVWRWCGDLPAGHMAVFCNAAPGLPVGVVPAAA